MIVLSILMATTPDRANMFNELFNQVHNQIKWLKKVHPSLGDIEVIVDDSPRFLDGGLSIGKKREALLKRANGLYLCYLDSDESIAPNYVETLVRLCNQGPDVVTFRNISKMDTYWMIVDMSFHYKVNDQPNPFFIVRRTPWHICPVKSHFAKMYDFEDTSYGEDYSWFEKVLRHCTTETHTDAVIHQYNHGKHSEADKITKHELLTK